MPPSSMPFGDLLRQFRVAAGITQDGLAERARLSPAAVSALERGRRRAPYRATVALLADALGLSSEQRAELESAAERGRVRNGSPEPGRPEVRLDPPGVAPTSNLPPHLTSFIGRETELAEVAALLAAHRLVTVTGSAGIGKTRTSLRCAEHLLDGFADGVWLIELAPLADGGYIPSSVAQSLRLTLAQAGDPVENLIRALEQKQALLVFDNCEHLVEPAARVIVAILKGCPSVKVLATSRHVLGISGEATYRMPTLNVPAAMSLFVERARSADNRFALTDENAPIVADICRRLDGIPLALELASSRVTMLSPGQLRKRLDERFRVLTGGSRDALPRQQTLRALIDWSHDLLDERERALFRRLGIFVNGFTLEGAEAVAGGENLDESDVFDMLSSLVDKSLVLAEPHGDSLRHRLLESTRAYASEKLADADEHELIAGRHLRYLRDRFARLFEGYARTAQRADLVFALRTDLEDVRSALDGALARSEVVDGGELLANTHTSWQLIGLETEGMAWCERYLAALPPEERRLRARLSTELSFLLGASGRQVRAFELATEAVEHARASGDGSSLGSALGIYLFTATALNRLDDAERALVQAEALPGISASDHFSILGARAYFSVARGDRETAANAYEQLRRESRALGNARIEFGATLNLAEVEHERGQTQRAIVLIREMLPGVRSAANKNVLVNMLHNVAGYLVAVDDLLGAAEAAHETIAILAAGAPDHPQAAVAVEHMALVVALRGRPARAAVLAGYADAAFQRHGFSRGYTEATTHGRLAAVLLESLPPGERTRLTAEGAALPPDAAVALAREEAEASP